MNVWEILLTALALSADAMTVAASSGFAAAEQAKTKNALLMAVFFGVFQAAAPLIGYYAIPFLSIVFGKSVIRFFETFAHFTAFALLSFIGAKMLFEAYTGGKKNKTDPFAVGALFIMAIATSIDALAVGIVFRSFAFRAAQLFAAVILIGLTAFSLSLAGVFLGKKIGQVLGEKFRRYSALLGGLTLIGLGVKLLIEQL